MEYCEVLKVKPWVDRTRPRPAPDTLDKIELPKRDDGETNHSFMTKAKKVIVEEIEKRDLMIQASPSLVSDKATVDKGVTFVVYVREKGPKPSDIKRTPVSKSGVAGSGRKMPTMKR